MLIKHIIGGKEVASKSGETFETINPATGEVIAQVCSGDIAEVDLAVKSSKSAFEQWGKMKIAERGACLHKVADLIEKNAKKIGLIETRDVGKPIKKTVGSEVPLTASIFRYYAGLGDKFRNACYQADPEYLVYSISQPYGPVGMIIPWNYPFLIIGFKCAAALLAGNTIIIKPSQATPCSAHEFGKICLEAGIPPGVVNVVQGKGSAVGHALVTHPAIRKISFTGSTDVGKSVMRAAAETIKPVTLELGGKNPNIVFEDADLEMAARGSVFTAYLNTGQICTSGSRLLVQESIYAKFIPMIIKEAGKLVMGDPENVKTDLGPMITRPQYDKVREYSELARKECKLLYAGNTTNCDKRGLFLPVEIFAADHGHKIAQEEIFGPLLTVIKFKNEEEAIAIANETEYGLSSAFWTQNLSRAVRMANALESGFVWGNTVHALFCDVPYGGLKQSGTGQELGVEGLKAFMQQKCCYLYTGK